MYIKILSNNPPCTDKTTINPLRLDWLSMITTYHPQTHIFPITKTLPPTTPKIIITTPVVLCDFSILQILTQSHSFFFHHHTSHFAYNSTIHPTLRTFDINLARSSQPTQLQEQKWDGILPKKYRSCNFSLQCRICTNRRTFVDTKWCIWEKGLGQ